MYRLVILLMTITLLMSGCKNNSIPVPTGDERIQTAISPAPSASNARSTNIKELPPGFEIMKEQYSFDYGGNKNYYVDPTDLKPKAEIELRNGRIQLRPRAGEKAWPRTNRFSGAYDVVYTTNEGVYTVLMGIDKMDVNLDRDDTMPIFRQLSFDTFDLIYFRPLPSGIENTNIYLFVVEHTGKAYPLQFNYTSNDGQIITSSFFDDAVGLMDPEVVDQRLTMLSGVLDKDGRGKAYYLFTFEPDLQSRTMGLVDTKGVTEQIFGAMDMGHALVSVIAQDELNIDEKDLASDKQVFTETAWNNKGFHYLIEKSKKDSGPYRIMYDAATPHILTMTDKAIVCIATFNLLYNYEQLAHMEMSLKKQDGRWIIYDLGTLKIDEVRNGDVYKKYGIQVGTQGRTFEDTLLQ